MHSTDLMVATETSAADVYVWQPSGKRIRVEIDLDVVDRMESEIMRAFGAVPRRGLEIGGILLGTAEAGGTQTVRIEDFEPVLSNHERGPSYILSGKDIERLEETLERWKAQPGRSTRVVGYYRSHTRERLRLHAEDLKLLEKYFPEESTVALIVKPFATRPSVAGLFFREEGAIQNESSYEEFPFRRRELGGNGLERTRKDEAAPTNGRPALEEALEKSDAAGILGVDPLEERPSRDSGEEPPGEPPGRRPRSVKLRGGWVMIPLSCMFLLIGTVLGFQVALSVRSQIKPGPTENPYALHVSATPSSDSVHVRWDRSAPAIRKAERGMLLITENGNQRKVDLDVGHLRNGSVIYRKVSGDVDFRLEVFANDKVSISETVHFRMEASGPPPGKE